MGNLKSLARGNQFCLYQLNCLWRPLRFQAAQQDLIWASVYLIRYMLLTWSCGTLWSFAYSNYKTLYLTKISGTYPKSADPKITLKGTSTYPIRYMVQTLPGDFIDVQGDKNT